MDESGLELGKIEAWISTIQKNYYMKILVSQDWICIKRISIPYIHMHILVYLQGVISKYGKPFNIP